MTVIKKEYEISKSEVVSWCRQAGDSNKIHLDERYAKDNKHFDDIVLPGMMVLDRVSGVVSEWGELKNDDVIITSLDSFDFKEPLYIGNRFEVELDDKRYDSFNYLDIIVRDLKEDNIVVTGGVNVILDR